MIFNASTQHRQPRAGGPRYVRLPDALDDIGRGDDGGYVNFNPIATLPKPIATPRSNAELLGNGLTLAQLDRAARFEVDQGAPIGIFYGKLLFALKLVSHLYEPGIPQNTFTGILGEGRGGLGDRGEWERIVAAYYAGQLLAERFKYQIWFEDRLPQGAIPDLGQDGWNWVSVNPTPYVGRYAHQSPVRAGIHQHFFTEATQGLALEAGDTISCWVFLDSTNPPTEVMLQFALPGDFEHRAYWGADQISFGTNGTASRFPKGALPATGRWVRLDVLASEVGLVGQVINGMAFTLFGGAATWSRVMKWNNTDLNQPGYIWRPGRIAPDLNDIVQARGMDVWLTGTACSGSAAATFRLTGDQAAQDRPDAVKVIAEC
ncbi:MAG TPA: hypothetical protein VI479_04885, partial [Blastocatellia bacterium]